MGEGYMRIVARSTLVLIALAILVSGCRVLISETGGSAATTRMSLPDQTAVPAPLAQRTRALSRNLAAVAAELEERKRSAERREMWRNGAMPRLELLGQHFPEDRSLYRDMFRIWEQYTPHADDIIARYRSHSDHVALFEREAQKRKVPRDFLYLIMHEAWFNDHAVSRAGAVGACQFMLETARATRLAVYPVSGEASNKLIDERRSFPHCIQASLNHVVLLFYEFDFVEDRTNRWQLAFAAYNCGSRCVQRAIERNGGDSNYFSVRRYLPRETADYLIKIAAEKYIAEHPYEFSDELFASSKEELCSAQKVVRLRSDIPLRTIISDSLKVSAREFFECNQHILSQNMNTVLPRLPHRPYYFFNMPKYPAVRLAAAP